MDDLFRLLKWRQNFLISLFVVSVGMLFCSSDATAFLFKKAKKSSISPTTQKFPRSTKPIFRSIHSTQLSDHHVIAHQNPQNFESAHFNNSIAAQNHAQVLAKNKRMLDAHAANHSNGSSIHSQAAAQYFSSASAISDKGAAHANAQAYHNHQAFQLARIDPHAAALHAQKAAQHGQQAREAHAAATNQYLAGQKAATFAAQSKFQPRPQSEQTKPSFSNSKPKGPPQGEPNSQAKQDFNSSSSPVQGIPKTRDESLKVLGLNSNATDAEIKSAYRKMALQVHPDKNPSPNATAQFQAVSAAYKMLKSQTH